MSPTIKKFAIPYVDNALSYSGLQRSPSGLYRAFSSMGLISLGAIAGAALGVLLSTKEKRKRVSNALSHGFGEASKRVSTALSMGLGDASKRVSNGVHAVVR